MNTSKITLKYALLLGMIALVCTAVSTGVYLLTKGRIDKVTANQQRALLHEVVPQIISIMIYWQLVNWQIYLMHHI